jgi:hypothetical protein
VLLSKAPQAMLPCTEVNGEAEAASRVSHIGRAMTPGPLGEGRAESASVCRVLSRNRVEILTCLALALGLTTTTVILGRTLVADGLADVVYDAFQQILPFVPPLSGTDIGSTVAAAAAMLDPSRGSYEPLAALHPLIGISWDVPHAHTHPPVEYPLFLPLVLIPYDIWLPGWFAFSTLCLAWSLRLVAVGPWEGYAIAVGFALTPVGFYSLGSTYPQLALCLAIAWRFRNNAWVTGTAASLFACGRFTGLLLLIYYPLTRRWRAVLASLSVLTLLTAISVVLEPESWGSYLTAGREAAEFTLNRSDNSSLLGAARHIGLPEWLPYFMIAGIAAMAYVRQQDKFWVLAWLSMALTPVAWTYAIAQLFPLAAAVWHRGALARSLIILTAFSIIFSRGAAGMVWSLAIVLLGLGLALPPASRSPRTEADAAAPEDFEVGLQTDKR